jgi:TonB family protein
MSVLIATLIGIMSGTTNLESDVFLPLADRSLHRLSEPVRTEGYGVEAWLSVVGNASQRRFYLAVPRPDSTQQDANERRAVGRASETCQIEWMLRVGQVQRMTCAWDKRSRRIFLPETLMSGFDGPPESLKIRLVSPPTRAGWMMLAPAKLARAFDRELRKGDRVPEAPAEGKWTDDGAPPVPIYQAMAIMPPLVDVEGMVLVRALVDVDGRVSAAEIVRSIPSLDSVAVEAVRRWIFTPGSANGRRVPVWWQVPVRFKRQPAPGQP